MRRRVWGAALLVVAMSTPAWTGDANTGRKPRLEVRTTRSLAFPPVEVVVIAELVGGEDVEELYCPGLEWDWGDGTKSYRESDCAPFEAGAKLARFFSARHVYGIAGSYRVRVRMLRAEKDVARASTSLQIGGLMAASRWDN